MLYQHASEHWLVPSHCLMYAGFLDTLVKRQGREAEAASLERMTAQWLLLLPLLIQACKCLPYPSAFLQDLFQVSHCMRCSKKRYSKQNTAAHDSLVDACTRRDHSRLFRTKKTKLHDQDVCAPIVQISQALSVQAMIQIFTQLHQLTSLLSCVMLVSTNVMFLIAQCSNITHLSLLGLNRLCKGFTMPHKTNFMRPAYGQTGNLIVAGHRQNRSSCNDDCRRLQKANLLLQTFWHPT